MTIFKRAAGWAAMMLGLAAAVPGTISAASAQTPVKFTLDWVFQGPTSPFLVALDEVGDGEILLLEGNGRVEQQHDDFREFHRARVTEKLEKLAEPVGILPLRCTEKKKSICIDKTTRLLRYVVNGKVAMVTDARFGAPGMETGEGIFSVHEKSFNHVSSRYHTWMPRAMFFNGDEAVHYSPDFASVGYLRGSHGCVGVRDMEKATWLFGQVPVGTRVYVYWS